MAFDIDNQNMISLTRGDSAVFSLFLNKGTDLLPLRYIIHDIFEDDEIVAREEVYLALEEPNQPFENAIVKKVFNSCNVDKKGDIIIDFKHDDTKCLIPGKYYLEIKAKLIEIADVDEYTCGIFYTSENGRLVEKVLPTEYEQGKIYYNVDINTVVQRTQFTLLE